MLMDAHASLRRPPVDPPPRRDPDRPQENDLPSGRPALGGSATRGDLEEGSSCASRSGVVRTLGCLLVGILGLVGCRDDEPKPREKERPPAAPPALSFRYDPNLFAGTLTVVPDDWYALPEKGTEIELRMTPGAKEPSLQGRMDVHGSRSAYPVEVSFGGRTLVMQKSERAGPVTRSIPLEGGIAGIRVTQWFPRQGVLSLEGRVEGTVEVKAKGYEDATLELSMPVPHPYVEPWLLKKLPRGLTLPDDVADGEGKGALLLLDCGGYDHKGLFGEARTLAEMDRVAVGHCEDTGRRGTCSYLGATLEHIHQRAIVKILDRRTGEVKADRTFPPDPSCPRQVLVQPGQKTLASGVRNASVDQWVAATTGYRRVTEKVEDAPAMPYRPPK